MGNQNYPFLKLTLDEKFPRLLVTRRPENKSPEQNIYGAFLPRAMVRRTIDLLANLFRLRPCELDIRGDFESPCPEYFLHKCLAPCVAAICSREKYLESVEIVHLFLSGQSEIALKKIDAKIERLAEDLEFEKAAEWHNARLAMEEIAVNNKWKINVSEMNDVIALTRDEDFIFLHLSTLKRGKVVGRLDFPFEKSLSKEVILSNFINEFYQFYAPKQIFVPDEFPERKSLEEKLRLNFNRKIKIITKAANELPPTVQNTQKLAAFSFASRQNKNTFAAKDLNLELKEIFNLKKNPRRVECFDVAHLAGKEIVASRVVAIEGVLQKDDNLVWEFEHLAETAALGAAVFERLRLLPSKKDLPDLIIVDGGKSQVNAAVKVLRSLEISNIDVIGAVKPPKAHNQISHFLTANSARIEFERRSKAMNFLQTLRDAAHTLANETHRQLHSLVQIFANNQNSPHVKYLLVPTRYSERSGNAEDLSPIRSLKQSGEIILKTQRKRPKDIA